MGFFTTWQVWLTLAIGVCVGVGGLLQRVGRRPKGYPPGPPTIPILGNIHLIPAEKRHLQFQKWAQEYGPIFSLVLGTQHWVILSADYAIKDLVDKRSGIYASRPDLYIPQQIFSGGLRPLFMPNNETLKLARKMNHRALKVEVARSYVPYQDLENRFMLLAFLENPDAYRDHIRRYTMSTTTQIAYGIRTTTTEDPLFKETFEIFDAFAEHTVSPSSVLLDFFPILRNLPDALVPIRVRAREMHKRELNLFRKYYLETKEKLRKGTAKPCVCVDLVKMQKEEGYTDDQAAYIGGSAVLQAGAETTSGILIGWVLAMVLFPDVVKTAQVELDRVCGDRLPDLNDGPDLPYVRAIMKETLRWMPGVPLGTPHACTQDNEYMGYKIPKGATIIMNVWSIHNNADRFPNPRQFDPMRYIDDTQTFAEAAANPDVSKRDNFVFGAGRRGCQGMHIADRSMFLAISRLLWAFDFNKAVDPLTRQDIVPDERDLSEGIFAIPNPFPADIVPRSAHKAQRIREVYAESLELLDNDLQWKTVPEGLPWRDYESEDYARRMGLS